MKVSSCDAVLIIQTFFVTKALLPLDVIIQRGNGRMTTSALEQAVFQQKNSAMYLEDHLGFVEKGFGCGYVSFIVWRYRKSS